MNRLLFILTLLFTLPVYGQLPEGSIYLGHGIYANKNKPDCDVTSIKRIRASLDCSCNLTDILLNGNVANNWMALDNSIYRMELTPRFQNVIEGGYGYAGYGIDPSDNRGYFWLLSDPSTNHHAIVKAGPNFTAERYPYFTDEDGPIQINPIVADTLITHKSDTGLIISYPVPVGSIHKYDISWFINPLILSGASITAECMWYDELGTFTTHSFIVSTIGYNIINNFNIAVFPGTNIIIHTSYSVFGSPIDYNMSVTITKIKKG